MIFYSYVHHDQRVYATTHVILLVEHQLVRGNLTTFQAHSAETTPLVTALWPGEAQNLMGLKSWTASQDLGMVQVI